MFIRFVLFMACCAIAAVHYLSVLPSYWGLLALVPLLPFLRGRYARFAWAAIGCVALFYYSVYRADLRTKVILNPEYFRQPMNLSLVIDSLLNERNQTVFAHIQSATYPELSGMSVLLYLNSLSSQQLATIRAGDQLTVQALLRPIYSHQNPFLFDYENYLYAKGIRLQVRIRQLKQYRSIDRSRSFSHMIERLRAYIKTRLNLVFIPSQTYAPIIRALVIGDQTGIESQHWVLFNRLNITHLVSISGAHITMLSTLVVYLSLYFLKYLSFRGRYLADYIYVKQWALCLACIVALFYCLLAGWGIPAQRTFLMFLGISLATLWGRVIHFWDVLLCSAVLILILDPWSIQFGGFWLSFLAVGILSALNQKGRFQLIKTQGLMTLALLPISVYLYHQFSWSSPIANLIAIPVVGMLITPLSLVIALFACFDWGLALAKLLGVMTHGILSGLFYLLSYLTRCEWLNWDLPSPSLLALCLAAMALLVLCTPWRRWAILILMPIVLVNRTNSQPLEVYALDIGQGTAVLVRTPQYQLLFDTGARFMDGSDASTRVILPFLKALGVKYLDAVVLSHADLDHVGGFYSLAEHMPIAKVYASFQVDRYTEMDERRRKVQHHFKNEWLSYEPCVSQLSWQWDDVRFSFLNQDSNMPIKSTNEQSCVLHMSYGSYRFLILGDLDREGERRLISQGLSKTHVIIAGHHGSKTSSSQELIQATQADYVVFQSGFLNRYHHPDPLVWAAWSKAHRLATLKEGAVYFWANKRGLFYRTTRPKHYWRLASLYAQLHQLAD